VRTYLKDIVRHADVTRDMDPKLKAHLQEMLSTFAKGINKREKTPVRKLAALYACVRLAHQRCNNEPEKKFWLWYLGQLEARAYAMKAEAAERIRKQDGG